MNWPAIVCFVILTISRKVSAQQPEIVDVIRPDVQSLGQTGRLNCTVARRGQSMVEWYHDRSKQAISINDEIIIQNNPIMGGYKKFDVQMRFDGDRQIYMLVIRRLRQQDSGSYTCTVRIGNVGSELWVRMKGQLTVQVAPTISTGETTTVLEVHQGANSSLMCGATGIPKPNITWTRSDGGLLPILPKPVAQFRSAHLPLVNIDVKHMGVYRCVADNNIKPPSQHLAEVLVFHAPITRVVQNSVGQIADSDATAKLDCIVQGHPEPTVSWKRLFNGAAIPVKDDDRFDVIKLTRDNQNLKAMESWYTLTVNDLKGDIFTQYYCIATNSYGSSTSVIKLFATSECQGPICTSPAVSVASVVQASFLVVTLIVCMALPLTHNTQY